jgi:hypothetical protein
MEIVSAYLVQKGSDRFNTYIVFFAPAYGGANIASAELEMHEWLFEDYKVPIFGTYNEARKHAHVQAFGLEDYYYCFPNEKNTA